MSSHILLVDDEAALVAVLEPVLTAAGYQVTTASSGKAALAEVARIAPDVILLDLGLPDIDGKEVIATLRSTIDTPVIVVSARHQEAEKIASLDEGADDYVDKPFEIGVLMARIRVALRRRPLEEKGVFRSGPLIVDFEKRVVQIERQAVRLSPKEYALLVTLARSGGQVVTHKRLLSAGWAGNAADTQYLRVYVGLLRQKIEADPSDPQLLLTEPGVGYRLVVADN